MALGSSGRYLYGVILALALAFALGLSLAPRDALAALPTGGIPSPHANGAPPASRPGGEPARDAPDAFTPTPTNTSTSTSTITPTPTITPNCPQNYTITQVSSGTVVSGTTLLVGSQCDDCYVLANLPFTYYFYNQPFNTVNVTSNGALVFGGQVDFGYTNSCLPDPVPSDNSIFALWADLNMDIDLQQCIDIGCGVFTSVSGNAPDRI